MSNTNVREFIINSLYKFNTYLRTNILPTYLEAAYMYDAYSYILNAIYDNEYVTAYALIQLNDNINDVSENYVTKSDLSAKSYLTNSSLNSTLNNYITKTILNNQSYITSDYLDAQSYVTSDSIGTLLEGDFVSYDYLHSQSYVSKSELVNQSYLTSSSLNNYITKSDLTSQSYLTSSSLTDYVSKTELDNQSYVTSSDLNSRSYITQADLSNNSYAGYSYIYDSYAYIMGKINTLELATGGGGSGTTAEGGITAISFNGTPASITGTVATIIAPINDPAIDITINGETYSFTLNQSTTYSIDLGTVLTQHQSLTDYVTKNELSNAGYITSGLPTVTSSDNGKILMVVNGAWQLISPATIYSGNASPSNSNGNNGDIYIQS